MSSLSFAIYYVNSKSDADRSFERAAKTWAASGKRRGNVCLLFPAYSETNLVAAWKQVLEKSKELKVRVSEGRIFTHASQSSEKTGPLEFPKTISSDGSFTASEIAALPTLPWASDGKLVLHGCNTGITSGYGAPAAQMFSEQQGITTEGQRGFSYFSKSPSEYKRIDQNSTAIYLWAFQRGKNSLLGSGKALPTAVYPAGQCIYSFRT